MITGIPRRWPGVYEPMLPARSHALLQPSKVRGVLYAVLLPFRISKLDVRNRTETPENEK